MGPDALVLGTVNAPRKRRLTAAERRLSTLSQTYYRDALFAALTLKVLLLEF